MSGVMHYAQRVSRNSKVPLYQQLYEILRGMILRRQWQPGDMVPPEPELCEQYGVSRTTVRQVLDKLVNEGLIYRERGRGTFVAHPTVEQALSRIISFTDDMRQRGATPGTQVLSAELLPAPEDIAGRLQIEPGEELACIRRLRLADGEPMAIEEAYLVHRYCQGLLQLDYQSNPLREILERQYGIRWIRAKQVIRAINAPRALAATLSIRPSAALLYIERVSYSQQELPLEFLRIYYRADRYSLHNELQG